MYVYVSYIVDLPWIIVITIIFIVTGSSILYPIFNKPTNNVIFLSFQGRKGSDFVWRVCHLGSWEEPWHWGRHWLVFSTLKLSLNIVTWNWNLKLSLGLLRRTLTLTSFLRDGIVSSIIYGIRKRNLLYRNMLKRFQNTKLLLCSTKHSYFVSYVNIVVWSLEMQTFIFGQIVKLGGDETSIVRDLNPAFRREKLNIVGLTNQIEKAWHMRTSLFYCCLVPWFRVNIYCF